MNILDGFAEVREKLQKKMAEAAQLDMVRADGYTLGEWIQVWYKLYSEPNIRESTRDYYKRFIHQHIIPKLGDVKLNKLTTREIQKFNNDLRTNGRVREAQKEKNPGLSVAYIKGVHRVLHSCLDRAVMEELILRNPSDACVHKRKACWVVCWVEQNQPTVGGRIQLVRWGRSCCGLPSLTHSVAPEVLLGTSLALLVPTASFDFWDLCEIGF